MTLTFLQARALGEQLEQYRDQLLDREEEVQQLSVQLEVSSTERQHAVTQVDGDLEHLKTENAQLQVIITLIHVY